MLMRLMSKIEFLIVPKGTKFTGPGKLGLSMLKTTSSDNKKVCFVLFCLFFFSNLHFLLYVV